MGGHNRAYSYPAAENGENQAQVKRIAICATPATAANPPKGLATPGACLSCETLKMALGLSFERKPSSCQLPSGIAWGEVGRWVGG